MSCASTTVCRGQLVASGRGGCEGAWGAMISIRTTRHCPQVCTRAGRRLDPRHDQRSVRRLATQQTLAGLRRRLRLLPVLGVPLEADDRREGGLPARAGCARASGIPRDTARAIRPFRTARRNRWQGVFRSRSRSSLDVLRARSRLAATRLPIRACLRQERRADLPSRGGSPALPLSTHTFALGAAHRAQLCGTAIGVWAMGAKPKRKRPWAQAVESYSPRASVAVRVVASRPVIRRAPRR